MPTWEEIEELRERDRLVLGGAIKNASGSQTWFRWAQRVPNYSELERLPEELEWRLETMRAIRTIKSRRRARPRVNYEKARAELEARGLAFIEHGFQSDAKKRPCAVRVIYVSAGDEILACESEPMTFTACEAVKNDAGVRFAWALHVEIVPAAPVSMHGIQRVEIPIEVRGKLAEQSDLPYRAALKTIPTHARFVVFPSQQERAWDETPRACARCGSAELCKPDCSIAPWNQAVVK